MTMFIELTHTWVPWHKNLWPPSVQSQSRWCNCCISNPITHSFYMFFHTVKEYIKWALPNTALQYTKHTGQRSWPVAEWTDNNVYCTKAQGLSVLHATHDSSCIIQSCVVYSWYFNLEFGISSIIDPDLHNSYRCLMKGGLTCNASKWDWSHSSSAEVYWKRVLISSSIKVASLSFTEMTMHTSLSWTSVTVTAVVDFVLAAVMVLMMGLVVGLATKQTLFLLTEGV